MMVFMSNKSSCQTPVNVLKTITTNRRKKVSKKKGLLISVDVHVCKN